MFEVIGKKKQKGQQTVNKYVLVQLMIHWNGQLGTQSSQLYEYLFVHDEKDAVVRSYFEKWFLTLALVL